jgi:hypothetical protein
MLGPLVISCVLCFAIFDYTVYVETGSSPLSWLWNSLAYVFGNLPIFSYLSSTNVFQFATIVLLGICVVAISLRQATKAMRAQITDVGFSRTDEVIKAEPVYEFDAVGQWLVTLQSPVVGAMFLNLKRDRTYEIAKPSGALVPFSQTLGSSGNWLYSPMSGALDLIQANGRMEFPIQITEKKNSNILGRDGENRIYIFTRQ